MNKTPNRLSSNVRSNMGSNTIRKVKGGSRGLSMLTWLVLMLLAVFTIILLVFLIQYLKTPCPPVPGKKQFLDYVWGGDPTRSPCEDPEPVQEYEEREKLDEEEVWNISDQVYTYPEAVQKCKAYGGRLATKQDMVKAYNKGAQWTG